MACTPAPTAAYFDYLEPYDQAPILYTADMGPAWKRPRVPRVQVGARNLCHMLKMPPAQYSLAIAHLLRVAEAIRVAEAK